MLEKVKVKFMKYMKDEKEQNSKDTKTDFHIKGYLPSHSDTSGDPTHELISFKPESNPESNTFITTQFEFAVCILLLIQNLLFDSNFYL